MLITQGTASSITLGEIRSRQDTASSADFAEHAEEVFKINRVWGCQSLVLLFDTFARLSGFLQNMHPDEQGDVGNILGIHIQPAKFPISRAKQLNQFHIVQNTDCLAGFGPTTAYHLLLIVYAAYRTFPSGGSDLASCRSGLKKENPSKTAITSACTVLSKTQHYGRRPGRVLVSKRFLTSSETSTTRNAHPKRSIRKRQRAGIALRSAECQTSYPSLTTQGTIGLPPFHRMV